jgi:hypothetical protein
LFNKQKTRTLAWKLHKEMRKVSYRHSGNQGNEVRDLHPWSYPQRRRRRSRSIARCYVPNARSYDFMHPNVWKDTTKQTHKVA